MYLPKNPGHCIVCNGPTDGLKGVMCSVPCFRAVLELPNNELIKLMQASFTPDDIGAVELFKAITSQERVEEVKRTPKIVKGQPRPAKWGLGDNPVWITGETPEQIAEIVASIF
jgi:hypothetical protein